MGKFITFEGGEGSGKSSVIWEVGQWLMNQGYSATITKDPGGTDVGDQIRKILLSVDNKDMVKETELLLYLASRAELVDKVIKPGLEKFDFVLSDRFYDSTTVYQGGIRGWNNFKVYAEEDLLQFLHRAFSGGLIPDHTFLLDVEPEIGLFRSLGDDKDEGKWEAEGLDIHKKINNEFRLMVMNDPGERFIFINANKDMNSVLQDIIYYFNRYILRG